MNTRHFRPFFYAVTFFCLLATTKAEEVIPQFEEPQSYANPSGMEAALSSYAAANWNVIQAFWKLDPPTAIQALKQHLEAKQPTEDDDTSSEAFKLLSAGILASMDHPAGKAYLIKSAQNEENQWYMHNAFWIIGHIERFHPELQKEKALKNTKWTEDFMLKMLREPKRYKSLSSNNDRQELAFSKDGGEFTRALALRKHPELFPTLETLWKESKTIELLEAFELLDDPRSYPLLLETLRDNDDQIYLHLAHTVKEMKIKEAVPILLERADEYQSYAGLIEFDDPRILPGLKGKLPELHGKALGEAKILIIKLEGGDTLPKLMELAKDPNHESGSSVIYEIYQLKDARAIEFITESMSKATRAHAYYEGLEFLSNFKNESIAIKMLIDSLTTDFNAIGKRRTKGAPNDYNKLYPERIAKHLNEMTGQDFGTDQAKWLAYYKEKYSNP